MGFCLYNNAVVAARAVQAQNEGCKVLIVDWDVHHGNGSQVEENLTLTLTLNPNSIIGSQEMVEGDSSILYVSLHRHEGGAFYPSTGAAKDVTLTPLIHS